MEENTTVFSQTRFSLRDSSGKAKGECATRSKHISGLRLHGCVPDQAEMLYYDAYMDKLTSPELDRLIPKLVRDEKVLDQLRIEVARRKTLHSILVGDSQDLSAIRNDSLHLSRHLRLIGI